MKRCLSCGKDIVGAAWQCPACGWEPGRVDGFLSFAPELAKAGADFPPDAHDALDEIQPLSFWFRARNRLIKGIVGRHFPDARRVLEIGCGTGFVLDGLARALPDCDLVGSEIYISGLVKAARRLGTRAELFQMDARRIPFRNEFDLVCAFDVIEHIEDDIAVIEQMREAAKPGAGIFIAVPQHPFLWSRSDDVAGHQRRYRTGELAEKCRACGLEIVVDTSFVTSLLPFMMATRLAQTGNVRQASASDLVPPAFINAAFEAVLNLEARLIMKGVKFPFGGSRFVLARKSPE